MREGLTIIIILLIVGITLDGVRRMRNARRDRLRMSPNIYKRQPANADNTRNTDNLYTSELPNGGARISSRSRSKQDVTEPFAAEEEQRQPEQTSLNLDESVPLLMESVTDEREPHLGGVQESESLDMTFARDEHERIEPVFSTAADPEVADRAESGTISSAPEEVLVINVMAREGQRFPGEALLESILQNGLRYGDMNIFHRHSDPMGTGPILFSLANMVKPGTFDLDAMTEFNTPGVTLFMTLPLDHDNMQAFELMADTARQLCDALGGELKDENRSVMTRQTLEHCRQRIRDFERRQLSRSPA